MLEHLWNGWRSTYVTSGGAAGGVGTDDVASGRGSVFTRILHSGLPDVDTHIVHRGTHVFAILNAFPYAVGHILVILVLGMLAAGCATYRLGAGTERLINWLVYSDVVPLPYAHSLPYAYLRVRVVCEYLVQQMVGVRIDLDACWRKPL